MNERNQAAPGKDGGPCDGWVEVGPGMVMARLDWDITMHRVVMVLLSQPETHEKGAFSCQWVRVQQIRDAARVTQKSIHQEVARAAGKLDGATIGVWRPDSESHERVPVFLRCVYKSRRGVLEAQFAPALREHVRSPKAQAVRYPLRYGMCLSTPYAIRIYEISKRILQDMTDAERRLPVSLFRRMFRLEAKYQRHCDMRRRVIAPAVAEVNTKTDVEVTCSDVREGQTPVALQWQVQSADAQGGATGKRGVDRATEIGSSASCDEGQERSAHEREDGSE